MQLISASWLVANFVGKCNLLILELDKKMSISFHVAAFMMSLLKSMVTSFWFLNFPANALCEWQLLKLLTLQESGASNLFLSLLAPNSNDLKKCWSVVPASSVASVNDKVDTVSFATTLLPSRANSSILFKKLRWRPLFILLMNKPSLARLPLEGRWIDGGSLQLRLKFLCMLWRSVPRFWIATVPSPPEMSFTAVGMPRQDDENLVAIILENGMKMYRGINVVNFEELTDHVKCYGALKANPLSFDTSCNDQREAWKSGSEYNTFTI